jgi:hypothetical protein
MAHIVNCTHTATVLKGLTSSHWLRKTVHVGEKDKRTKFWSTKHLEHGGTDRSVTYFLNLVHFSGSILLLLAQKVSNCDLNHRGTHWCRKSVIKQVSRSSQQWLLFVVTVCSLVEGYQHYRGTCCLPVFRAEVIHEASTQLYLFYN